jgi:hypothetical protein
VTPDSGAAAGEAVPMFCCDRSVSVLVTASSTANVPHTDAASACF